VRPKLRWAFAVLLLPVTRAGAQQPAAVTPPLTGHVQSVDGLALADAEVTIDGERRIVRTSTQGVFSIPNVSKGIHTINVRRIGYLPAMATVQTPQANDAFTISLLPTRTELDTVKVAARVNVLAGVVVDEQNRPIAGATVDIIGTRRTTVTTGDDGWFSFTGVNSGPTILRVLRAGFVGATKSVQLQDWRGVVVRMSAIDTTLSKTRQAYYSGLGNAQRNVWLETQMRLNRRAAQTVIITSEELAPLRDLTLGEAITHVPSAVNLLSDMQANRNAACVLLNGFQMIGQVSLDTYNTEDVEFVELYPSVASAPSSIRAYLQIAGCPATRNSGMGGGVFYAVVWLKP
jgi:hypothetical protein